MPRVTQRLLISLLALLGVVAACGGDGDGSTAEGSTSTTAAAAPRTITILQSSHNLSFLPLYVAQRLGYFEENGVTVEIADTPGSGAVNIAALKDGDAWGLVNAPEQAMLANAHGQDIRSIVALTQTAPQSLVARAGYESSGSLADDLRGKRVAVTTTGSPAREVALETLRSLGIDPATDLTVVEGNDAARVASLEAGEVDFAFLSQPSLASALQAGIVTDALVSTADVLGRYHGLTMLITGDEADSDPATAQAVVDALVRAAQLIAAEPDEAFAVATEEFPDVEATVLRSAFDFDLREEFWSPDGKLSEEGLERSKAIAAIMGSLDPAEIDVTKAVDRSFGS